MNEWAIEFSRICKHSGACYDCGYSYIEDNIYYCGLVCKFCNDAMENCIECKKEQYNCNIMIIDGTVPEFMQRVEYAVRRHFKSKYVHSSSIGFCLRKIQFSNPEYFPNAEVPVELVMNKKDRINAGMAIGTLIGKTAPFWYPGAVYEIERIIEIDGVKFQVHPDIYDPIRNKIIEIKTTRKIGSIAASDYMFDAYLMQVHMQMKAFNLTEAAIWVFHINANELIDLFEEVYVRWNDLVWDAVLTRIHTLKTEKWYQIPPAPEWECNGCGYFEVCWRSRQ